MYFYELFSAFSLYGGEVFIFAFLTTLLIQLLKNHLLKITEKRALTFAPFIIGTLIYAVYSYFLYGSEYLFSNFFVIVEHGILVGTLATFIYVIYEQFIRKTPTALSLCESLVLALIKSYVKQDDAERIAKEICLVSFEKPESECVLNIETIILQNAEKEICENELKALSALIYKSCATFSPTKNSAK